MERISVAASSTIVTSPGASLVGTVQAEPAGSGVQFVVRERAMLGFKDVGSLPSGDNRGASPRTRQARPATPQHSLYLRPGPHQHRSLRPGGHGIPPSLLISLTKRFGASHRVEGVAVRPCGIFQQLSDGDRHHDDADALLGYQLPVVHLPLLHDRLDVGYSHRGRPSSCGRHDLIPIHRARAGGVFRVPRAGDEEILRRLSALR